MDNINDDHVIGDGPQDLEFVPRTTVFIIDAQAADAKMPNLARAICIALVHVEGARADGYRVVKTFEQIQEHLGVQEPAS